MMQILPLYTCASALISMLLRLSRTMLKALYLFGWDVQVLTHLAINVVSKQLSDDILVTVGGEREQARLYTGYPDYNTDTRALRVVEMKPFLYVQSIIDLVQTIFISKLITQLLHQHDVKEIKEVRVTIWSRNA